MKITNKKQIIDVDLDLLSTMSINLAEKIKQSGFIPNHILYIERAGILTGFEFAQFFNRPVSAIISRRSGTGFKSKIKFILRLLPRFITHFLRRLELKSTVHKVNSKRNVTCKGTLPLKNKTILLVDDALDTGHSMAAVLNWLETRGFARKNIKTAVLTTTGKSPQITADFSLLDQVICAFPWSYDSRSYNKTKNKMATIRKRIAKNNKPVQDFGKASVASSIGLTSIEG